MSDIREEYRKLNGQCFRQPQLLRALAEIRVRRWLFPEVDVDDMAKDAIEEGWIKVNGDGTFTVSVT